MFYSAKTGGFYDASIHGDVIPANAVEISIDQHAALLAGQSKGKIIVPDESGNPVLADPLPADPQKINSVTMRQARLALLDVGLLDDVDAAIAAIPDDTQRKAAQIEWEYAGTVDRSSPFTQQLAVGLGLDSSALDALFTEAAKL
jgi:hypothetical protein